MITITGASNGSCPRCNKRRRLVEYTFEGERYALCLWHFIHTIRPILGLSYGGGERPKKVMAGQETEGGNTRAEHARA